MNQSIQNGLNDLFDQIIPISGDFNKKRLMRIRLKMHTRSISRFLLRLHRNARIRKTDRKRLKRFFAVLPDRMREVLDQESSKRKKKMYL